MLRYERDMDLLRALAIWITTYEGKPSLPSLPRPTEYVFDLIKFYSKDLAEDILKNSHITSDTINRFNSSLCSVNKLLGITDEDIKKAGEQQRYMGSGFWEMRRVIGQFGDVAEMVIEDKVTHIITAAVSGCIIGEYLGMVMFDKHDISVPVDHMIFARDGVEPVSGHLSKNFIPSGNHYLIVDDAVMETNTARVMIKKITQINPQAEISLMVIDIDQESKYSGFLDRFAHVYMFEE